jgi:hypothetical protein
MFSFKKVEPPKPPKHWNAHVTGEVKFEGKEFTTSASLIANTECKVVMTKGDKSIEFNIHRLITLAECQFYWEAEQFYNRAVTILQNRRGELDMLLNEGIEDGIKRHFRDESEKSAKVRYEELLKETIHIKIDMKIREEDVFQA